MVAGILLGGIMGRLKRQKAINKFSPPVSNLRNQANLLRLVGEVKIAGYDQKRRNYGAKDKINESRKSKGRKNIENKKMLKSNVR